MKKLFTLFTAVLVSIFCMAVSLDHSSVRLVESNNAEVEDTVSIYYTDLEDGVLSVIWQGDSTKSKIYNLYLATFDTATYNYQGFAELAAYSKAFAISGYDGFYSCSTDLVLQYGDNYTTIGEFGASSDVVAAWQSAWNASVNEDNSLKPGFYVLFIEGDDLDWNTTEVEDYVIFEVEDVSTQANEVVIVKAKNATKYFNGKNIVITNGVDKFDISGRKIE